jgi:rRNA maturation RNase YbeY
MDVEITVLDARYADYASRLKDVVVAAAHHMAVINAHAEAYIVGTTFMEKNVLAYPAPEGFPRPDLGGVRDLGELYINPEHIASHGEDFTFMAVHAFLHLLGYDHHGKHDTVKMEAKEQEILAAIFPKPHE